MAHRSYRSKVFDVEYVNSPLVNLWLLRMLVPLNAQNELIQHSGFRNDALAASIGLEQWVNTDKEFEPRAIRAELWRLHGAAEQGRTDDSFPGCLGANVARLASVVGLNDTDCCILTFAVMLHSERVLDEAADWLGQLTTAKALHVLAIVLDLPAAAVRASLDPKGALCRSGLLSMERGCASVLRSKLTLLSEQFAELISMTEADPIGLLRDTVGLSSAGHLLLSAFDHLDLSLQVLSPYLKQSLASGRVGVNICLHGDAGTGKNQLAKALAADLNCELFEVASEDSDGDPVSGGTRLRALRAAQNFLARRRAILLFDEAEDVFSGGGGPFAPRSTAQQSKAWMNRALEENTVPTFWLSNSIGDMDAAFIRRFDMVIELPVPPKRQRERIIREACAGMLDARAVARVAESESLAPAVVARVASVIQTVSCELGVERSAAAVERLIGNILEAQGHPSMRHTASSRLPPTYDPAFIHADVALVEVAAGLQRAKSGRLCLYGPPGTGKTAYANWLAEQLGMPIHVKRGSDLMSKWVGENEQNIAKAFRQAERDGAVLLIDEVDSFLQDRRGVQQSWEHRLVNEMLTQMESFDGIFIASTNLIDGLDLASLRRFDLKVKFDFLGPDSAWELFLRHCAGLGLGSPEPALRPRLQRLATLTPGDFAAVARQSRFRALTVPVDLFKALEAECAIKAPGRSQPIGFVWPAAGSEINHPQENVMPACERSLCTGSPEPGGSIRAPGVGASR